MHKIAYAAIIAAATFFSAPACTPQQQAAPNPRHNNETPEELARQAQKGSRQAQLLLGNYYCAHEPAKERGANTLKWWKRAAQDGGDGDPYTRAQAMESLGNYYLALYKSHEDYDPDSSRPKAPCTGISAGESHYSEAKEWFTRCVNLGPAHSEGCEAGLANLHHSRNEFEEAYFWRAIALGGMLDDMTLSRGTPISLKDEKLQGMPQLKRAQQAARRLPAAEVAALNASARKWLNERDDRVHAQLVSSLPPKPWRAPAH